jgi:hypothetical protein
MLIKSLINDYDILATLGTAKNTGKTTTLNYILPFFKDSLGLISTGHDGEDCDALINSLAKPSIEVQAGTFFTTSKDFILPECEIIKRTKIISPLGEIFIVRTKFKSKIQLIGPSNNSGISYILSEYKKLGIAKCLIDGSFDRKSVISLVKGFILATGASFSLNPEIVLKNLKYIKSLFSLKLFTLNCATISNFEIKELKSDSQIYIQGYVCNELVNKLKLLTKKNIIIGVNDPTALFISSDYYYALCQRNIIFQVKHNPKLLFITINPFSYLGSIDLTPEIIEKQLNVPVFNIKNCY